MATNAKNVAKVKASSTALARKVKRLNQLIDLIVQECGPMFPGLAAVVTGARKLLLQPAPGGKQRTTFRSR